MGLKLNRNECAKAFDVTPRTIDEWVLAGCPIEKRGSRGVASVFDSGKIHRWDLERKCEKAPSSAEELRAKKIELTERQSEKIGFDLEPSGGSSISRRCGT